MPRGRTTPASSRSAAAKLDDGAGWPAFWAPFYGAVAEGGERPPAVLVDALADALAGAFAAPRAAVRCSRCGGHLGTLSRGAPTPTGLRCRVDGLALDFTPAAPGLAWL